MPLEYSSNVTVGLYSRHISVFSGLKNPVYHSHTSYTEDAGLKLHETRALVTSLIHLESLFGLQQNANPFQPYLLLRRLALLNPL